MLKLSLLALAVFASCQVDGGKFQRQEVLEVTPYPPSGFRPEGNGFELPTESELPVEQLDNKNELEEFNRLRLKSGKLVQGQFIPQQSSQLQPLNYVQQTSPIFAAPVQPQLAFNSPLDYAAYLQAQQQYFQPQQANEQESNFSDKLQQSSQLTQNLQPTFRSNVPQDNLGRFQQTEQLKSMTSSRPTGLSRQLRPTLAFSGHLPENVQQITLRGKQQQSSDLIQPLQGLSSQSRASKSLQLQQAGQNELQLSSNQIQQLQPAILSPQPTVFSSQLQQPFALGSFSELQQPSGTFQQFQPALLNPQPVFSSQYQQPFPFNGQSNSEQENLNGLQQYSSPIQQLQSATQPQQQVLYNGQLQQPAIYSAQLQQPTVYGAPLQLPTAYSAQLQQPSLFNGQLLQQNNW